MTTEQNEWRRNREDNGWSKPVGDGSIDLDLYDDEMDDYPPLVAARTEASADVVAAKELLKDNGFVVLREKSYRQAQERQRVAEALREMADRDRENHYEWMRRDVFPEERRLRDRCQFLYGAARAHGATADELAADPSMPVPAEVRPPAPVREGGQA